MKNWINKLMGFNDTSLNFHEESAEIVDEHSKVTVLHQGLLDHFKGLSIKEYRPNLLYHGGFHNPKVAVQGALWFHVEEDKKHAERYKFWGNETPTLKRVLLCAKPVKTLKLLEFPGNHIEILRQVYGRAWGHAEFAKDATAIGAPDVIGFDGLYRPLTNEYFIINVQDNLEFISKE